MVGVLWILWVQEKEETELRCSRSGYVDGRATAWGGVRGRGRWGWGDGGQQSGETPQCASKLRGALTWLLSPQAACCTEAPSTSA